MIRATVRHLTPVVATALALAASAAADVPREFASKTRCASHSSGTTRCYTTTRLAGRTYCHLYFYVAATDDRIGGPVPCVRPSS